MPLLIVHLLRARCPPAIAWLIVAVILAAVDRVGWRRSRPHILQETFDARFAVSAVSPPVANGDAAGSVVPVVLAFWIKAASHYIEVNVVLRIIRLATDAGAIARRFATQASTAFRPPSGQLAALYDDLSPALAHASP